jgi:hypothetical protein
LQQHQGQLDALRLAIEESRANPKKCDSSAVNRFERTVDQIDTAGGELGDALEAVDTRCGELRSTNPYRKIVKSYAMLTHHAYEILRYSGERDLTEEQVREAFFAVLDSIDAEERAIH